MKKFIALALTAAMAISMVACSSAPASSEGEGEGEAALTYKTGLGTVISYTATAENAENEKGASAQVNTSIVVATFDSEDRVVSATIDVAQNKATFDMDGKLAGEVDTRTKVEKEGDYGMLGSSAIGKEYFEQVEALAEYWVGKTLDEIVSMPTFQRDESHTAVPDVEDLKSSVTITVGDYIEALKKAYDNAVETSGVPAKTGLGVVVSPAITEENIENEKGAAVQMNTNIIAVALDEAGTIVAAQLDVAQQKVSFDLEGKETGTVDLRTKVEKQGDYGMLGSSAIGKEYFEQAEAFTTWMVGQTPDAVLGMATYDKGDGSHTAVPDVEDLKSSVTITVGDYLAALEKAVANAK